MSLVCKRNCNANAKFYNHRKKRGVVIWQKTANLYTRIDPELKEQAEHILNSLGLPPSSAITMFYKQVVLQQGLPFNVKLNYRQPLV